MEYVTWMWAFFGFLAFLQVTSLRGRLSNLESKLERKLRNDNDVDEFNHSDALRESLQKRIGEMVTFEFYDDEEDLDIANKNPDFVQIVDVDEKWVLVHAEKGKKKIEKLIRISSIKGIKQQ